MSGRGLRLALAAVFAAGAVVLGTQVAGGAVGDMKYRGCITGEGQSGPFGTDACAAIASASSGGGGSGMDGAESLVLSQDGKSLYYSASGDDAIVHFRRNPRTGKLRYRGCITGDTDAGPTGTGACRQIPSATAFGGLSGLDDPRQAVVSPDGRSLYVVSAADDSLARFSRNRRTGRLTYKGCITGDTDVGPTGSGACRALPEAAGNGTDSGLNHAKALILSGNGKSLYVAAVDDEAVTRFKRRRTGTLKFQGCLTGNTDLGPGGSGACKVLPGATSGGGLSGFNDVRQFAMSGDGKSLYTVAADDDAVARFTRNRRTGRLAYRGCITGDTQVDACREVADATPGADDSGFENLRSLSLSRDGRSLYATARHDDALLHFKRNVRTGKLRYTSCLTAEEQTGPAGTGACRAVPQVATGGADTGMDLIETVEVSRDGRSVYAIGLQDDSAIRFRRNRRTGTPRFASCLTGETQASTLGVGPCSPIPSHTPNGDQSGLENPQFLVLSSDRRWLYVASRGDDSVASFRLQR